MNALDYVLLVIIAVSVITAAVRGFVYEVWMMIAAAVAVVVGAWQYASLAGWFTWIDSHEARDFFAFAVIVAAILIIAAIIGRIARGAVHAVGLGGFDHFFGACLGLLRGLVLGVAVMAMLTACGWQTRQVEYSELAPGFLWGARAMVHVLPGDVETRFQAGVVALRSGLPTLIR